MNVTLFLNHACNMACSYCYGGAKLDRPMPEEILHQAVEMAFSGPRARVAFFGGEPLLEFEKIRRAVALARQLQAERGDVPLRFSLTVNGTLLDEKKLRFLSDEHFHLVISIDGDKKAHEATRPMADGRSSYNDVVTNLKSALLKIPSTETLSVIDPANVNRVSRSVIALLDLGVKNINFTTNYEANWTDHHLSILEAQLDEVVDIYVELYRQANDIAIDLIDSKIITQLKDGYSCQDRCKFGHGQVTVAPSGRLYPCERLVGEDDNHDVTIGHVDTGVDLDKVLAMARTKNTPDRECADCDLMARCMYWCGCVNYATTGSVDKTSGILCRLEQLLIGAADKAGGILFKEKNPMFQKRFYSAV